MRGITATCRCVKFAALGTPRLHSRSDQKAFWHGTSQYHHRACVQVALTESCLSQTDLMDLSPEQRERVNELLRDWKVAMFAENRFLHVIPRLRILEERQRIIACVRLEQPPAAAPPAAPPAAAEPPPPPPQDFAAQEEQLRTRGLARGLALVETPKNGNCFLHAVGVPETDFPVTRRTVVDGLLGGVLLVDSDYFEGGETGRQKWLNDTLQDGNWFAELGITLWALLNDKHLRIISGMGDGYDRWVPLLAEGEPKPACERTVYVGHIVDVHYVGFRPMPSSSKRGSVSSGGAPAAKRNKTGHGANLPQASSEAAAADTGDDIGSGSDDDEGEDVEEKAGVALTVNDSLLPLMVQLETAHKRVLEAKARVPPDSEADELVRRRRFLLEELGVSLPRPDDPNELPDSNWRRPNVDAQCSALLALLRALLLGGAPDDESAAATPPEDRGVIAMACGSGKTFVALWAAIAIQRYTDASDMLFLVPNLTLVGQLLKDRRI